MHNWTVGRLGDVAELKMGQSPSSEYVSESADKESLPFLQGNADFGSQAPQARFHCSRPLRKSKAGDILISVRAPVGEINRSDQAYCIGRGLAAVRFTGIDPKFGWHVLAHAASGLYSLAQGSTFAAIGRQELGSLVIGVPPPQEQRKIAEVLDTADEAIRSTERLIVKIKMRNAGLLRLLATRGMCNSSALRSSQFGEIPAHWTIRSCEEVCRQIVVGIVIRPTQYYRSTGIPILRSANVLETGIELTDLKFMSLDDHRLMSKSAVSPGDVVTVRTGTPGTSAVVPVGLSVANCVDVIISRPNRAVIDPNFLAAWINSEFGKGQVLAKQGGLAQQHFNVGHMRNLLVATPPLDEQKEIAGVVATQQKQLQLEYEELAKLRKIKEGLMGDLLTGRIRVRVD